jgi:excisionase family DNA binding protein
LVGSGLLGLAAHLAYVGSETPGFRGLEPLLSVGELADYLGVPVSTIYDWRTGGHGPVAHRFGKHIKFALTDVRAWVAAQRETPPGGSRPADAAPNPSGTSPARPMRGGGER